MRAATRETERDDGAIRRGRALAAGLAGAGLALLLGGLLGVVLGVVAAGAVWRGSSGVEPRNVRRRRQELRRSLPAVVDLMASSLAVGLSTSSALEAVVRAVDDPMRSELRAISGALELGVDPVVVWGGIDAGSELAPLGRCLERAIETGAAVSESLHRLGLDLRREERAAVEDRARAVGVQAAVPLGLCLLPAFLLVGVVPLVAAAVTELLGR
jgi:Flp pilus assembly protein TadB